MHGRLRRGEVQCGWSGPSAQGKWEGNGSVWLKRGLWTAGKAARKYVEAWQGLWLSGQKCTWRDGFDWYLQPVQQNCGTFQLLSGYFVFPVLHLCGLTGTWHPWRKVKCTESYSQLYIFDHKYFCQLEHAHGVTYQFYGLCVPSHNLTTLRNWDQVTVWAVSAAFQTLLGDVYWALSVFPGCN